MRANKRGKWRTIEVRKLEGRTSLNVSILGRVRRATAIVIITISLDSQRETVYPLTKQLAIQSTKQTS